MTNFWGNSSSQYIAKKIIRPDFCATPGERVLSWMTFDYPCFGKVLVTHLYESQTLPKCDTDRGHTWSEATQTFLDIKL
jgi:hypothetical protein